MKFKIGVAKRTALLKLNNNKCDVRLKEYGDKIFTTNGELKYVDDDAVIFINELQKWFNVENITYMSIIDRFNSSKTMIPICWQDEE